VKEPDGQAYIAGMRQGIYVGLSVSFEVGHELQVLNLKAEHLAAVRNGQRRSY